MKAYVIYKIESDHARAVTDFLRDFQSRTGKKVESIDPESADGSSFCRTYDIVDTRLLLQLTTMAFANSMARLAVTVNRRGKAIMLNELKQYLNTKIKIWRITGGYSLAVGAILSLLAAFVLSVEVITPARNPEAALSCSVNVVVNCATVAKHPRTSFLVFLIAL